jgi:transposase
LLALTVTPANEGDRTQVETLCEQVQEVTGDSVQLVWVDAGYTGENPDKTRHNRESSHVVKLEQAKQGFVLLLDVGLWNALCVGQPLPPLSQRL